MAIRITVRSFYVLCQIIILFFSFTSYIYYRAVEEEHERKQWYWVLLWGIEIRFTYIRFIVISKLSDFNSNELSRRREKIYIDTMCYNLIV